MDQVEAIVIGAGIVGLACARALAAKGLEVVVIEAADAIGTETSSRHSEVIHAGIYYPTDSLKARFCVEGKSKLYQYCQQRHIGHKKIGKVIVATDDDQIGKLEQYKEQAELNGVDDLCWLSQAEFLEKEPAVKAVTALWSPSTGIFDSHDVMVNFQADLEKHGGVIALSSPVKKIEIAGAGFVLDMGGTESYRLKTQILINAAGLEAVSLAKKMDGLEAEHIPSFYLAKGNYFRLQGPSPFNHLVYPVAVDGGLGVHATIDLAGQVRFGPDVEWIDEINYDVSRARLESFVEAIATYYPEITTRHLDPAYAGIRPKLSSAGQTPQDFLISGPDGHGIKGLVNLFGIESPGATSSMAIGDYVADMF